MKTVNGAIVFAAYTPKPGREADLVALIADHLPLLQRLGLATDRPALLLRSRSSGTHIEIFEWVSDAAAQEAHDIPEIMALWARFAEVADFTPLASLPEIARPFPHFDIVELPG